MSKLERVLTLIIAIISLVFMAIQTWDVLERRAMMSAVGSIITWSLALAAVAYSAFRMLRDAHNAESLVSTVEELNRKLLGHVAAASELRILNATWGNAVSRVPVTDFLNSRPRNGLNLYVSPGSFPGGDPAPGDDSKFAEVEYTIPGKPSATVRRKQGQWIVLPEDSLTKAELEKVRSKNDQLKALMPHKNGEDVLVESLYLASDFQVAGGKPLMAIVKNRASGWLKEVTAFIDYSPIGHSDDPFRVPAACWHSVAVIDRLKHESLGDMVDIGPGGAQSLIVLIAQAPDRLVKAMDSISPCRHLLSSGRWSATLNLASRTDSVYTEKWTFLVTRDGQVIEIVRSPASNELFDGER